MQLVINGMDTYAATGGRDHDTALPLIVFVHGAGLDHTVWALLARWFAHRGFAVLAPDLPGHGRSAGEPLDSIARHGGLDRGADRGRGREQGDDHRPLHGVAWSRSRPPRAIARTSPPSA